jgi:hypothetical protein
MGPQSLVLLKFLLVAINILQNAVVVDAVVTSRFNVQVSEISCVCVCVCVFASTRHFGSRYCV